MNKQLLITKLKLKKILSPALLEGILKVYRNLFGIPLFNGYNYLFFRSPKLVHIGYRNIHYNLMVNPQNGALDKYIFFYKLYEPEVSNIFLQVIKEGDNILDIGANIGYHSIFLSRLTGETGKVYSFEPIKRLCEQIKNSIQLNSINNIQVYNYALGNQEYKAVLHIDSKHLGGSSIIESSHLKEKEEIEVKVLDTLELPKISLIKLDTEGYEWNVVKGAQKIIERDKPNILFEYNPLSYERQNKGDAICFLNYLREHDYRLFDIENQKEEIIEINNYLKIFDETSGKYQSNILAKCNSICQTQ